jgi:hypothetical protein
MAARYVVDDAGNGLFARMPHLQLKTGQILNQLVTLAPGVTFTNQPIAGAKFFTFGENPSPNAACNCRARPSIQETWLAGRIL